MTKPLRDTNMTTDKQLDELHNKIDGLLVGLEFDKVGKLLEKVSIVRTTTDMLLGYLTATLPARSRIVGRQGFADRVYAELKVRNGPRKAAELMKGLW